MEAPLPVCVFTHWQPEIIKRSPLACAELINGTGGKVVAGNVMATTLFYLSEPAAQQVRQAQIDFISTQTHAGERSALYQQIINGSQTGDGPLLPETKAILPLLSSSYP